MFLNLCYIPRLNRITDRKHSEYTSNTAFYFYSIMSYILKLLFSTVIYDSELYQKTKHDASPLRPGDTGMFIEQPCNQVFPRILL